MNKIVALSPTFGCFKKYICFFFWNKYGSIEIQY